MAQTSDQMLWNQITGNQKTEAAQIEQENTGKPFYEWQSVTPEQKAIDIIQNPVAKPQPVQAQAPAPVEMPREQVQPALRQQPIKRAAAPVQSQPVSASNELKSQVASGADNMPEIAEPTVQVSSAPRDQSSPKGDDQFDWKELMLQAVVAGGPMMLDALLTGGKYMPQAARAGQQAQKGYATEMLSQGKRQQDHQWELEKEGRKVASQPKPITGYDEETGKQAYGILSKDDQGNTYFKNAATGGVMTKFIPENPEKPEKLMRGRFQPKQVLNRETGLNEYKTYDTATDTWKKTNEAVAYKPWMYQDAADKERYIMPANSPSAQPRQITGVGDESSTRGVELSQSLWASIRKDGAYSEAEDALNAGNRVMGMLALNNAVTKPAFQTQMAKLAGDKGALSDGDVARYGGSKALVTQAQALLEEMRYGRMQQDNVAAYKVLVGMLVKKRKEVMNSVISQYESSASPATSKYRAGSAVKAALDPLREDVGNEKPSIQQAAAAELARRRAQRGAK